ncbi:cell division protein FtsX [Calditrichota bacterium]
MIVFAMREGWRNFRNLGVIGLLTLASLTMTLTLVGLAANGYFLIEGWRKGLLGRFEIEAFLAADADTSLTENLLVEIEQLPHVAGVRYISPEEAARRFSHQFGEDILQLLTANPLPPSIVVSMNENADPLVAWRMTAMSLSGMKNIDDVVYQGDLLKAVNSVYTKFGLGALIALGTALCISLFFTALAVKGSIRAREDFIRIVALSGGSRAMLRGAFVMLGGYYGMFAAVIAGVAVWIIVKVISVGWGFQPQMPIYFYAGFLPLGMLIGMFGAGVSAQKRIRRV